MKSGRFKLPSKTVLLVLFALFILSLIVLFSRGFIHYSNPISQQKALSACPFILISQEEYNLLRQIRQDEDVASYITRETPPGGAFMADYEFKEIEDDILARYEGILTINGTLAAITTSMITDYGSITLGYSIEGNMCYLTLSSTGTVTKTCAEYKGTSVIYIAENRNNEEFTKLTRVPKILYDLFLQ